MQTPIAASFFLSEVAWTCFISMCLAQFLKPFFAIMTGEPFSVGRMFYTGGMPSSHTSLVTTLTLCIGHVEGTSGTLFSLVLLFSLYFIFEATGLRQEVGQQARVLNEMLDELYKTHQLNSRRLKELVGHTWQEVLGGALVGFVVYWLLRGWIDAGG